MTNTPYNHIEVEKSTQSYWQQNKSFSACTHTDKNKNFYCLSMFPYPSGKLHMGHVRNYTIPDLIARFKRMQGYNLLHPIGWDAFGLPAENAAIVNKDSPHKWTQKNIKSMTVQLKSLGLSYDWARELATCNSDYYAWEQWFFIQLYKRGLVYKKLSTVNWCPQDATVLANEQVIDGNCWRCDTPVVQKNIKGWFIKITAYAQVLLDDLKLLEKKWPDQVIAMQRNWIGRSVGVEIFFATTCGSQISVFTTRVDTLMGVTYLALSVHHPLAIQMSANSAILKKFVDSCINVSSLDISSSNFEKKGIDTGLIAIHPISGQHIPVWIANFVLIEYGSGAVMSVPAHDQRDWEFARKYNLPVIQVIANDSDCYINQQAFTGYGYLISSGEFSGLDTVDAKQKIVTYLINKAAGREVTNYRLRDWGVSRQRYWGTPIPIIICSACGDVPVDEQHLPVKLPLDIVLDTPSSPLKSRQDFYYTLCPQCGGSACRETDTLDTFVESSWYFLAYACGSNKIPHKIFDDAKVREWLPVDQYVGGIEHAVLHLLYARFFYKVARDLLGGDNIKSLPKEPFKRLLTQGMVLKDGMKMSKSKGNVVDPQFLVEKYGADTVRLFILFAAPPTVSLEWSDSGVAGSHRFLNKIWNLVHSYLDINQDCLGLDKTIDLNLRHKLYSTLDKVTDDIERRQVFNTAIAAIMEMTNELTKAPLETKGNYSFMGEALDILVLILSPFVPHICHVLWHKLGHEEDLTSCPWPKVSQEASVAKEITCIVQLNGKLKARLNIPPDLSDIEIENLAKVKIGSILVTKKIKKVIFVPNKLINFVY